MLMPLLRWAITYCLVLFTLFFISQLSSEANICYISSSNRTYCTPQLQHKTTSCRTHQTPFPSPLSQDDTGYWEAHRRGSIRKNGRSAHGSKYSRKRSMLICSVLIAEDQPESLSLSLSLSPLPLGAGYRSARQHIAEDKTGG